MNREQIIKHFTDNIQDYQRFSKNIAGEDWNDLFQECSLMLLEFPENRIIGYWNETQGLKPFFLRMLCNQYKSKTSKFHKLYRKEAEQLQNHGKGILEFDELNEAGEETDIKLIKNILDIIYEETEDKEVADLERIIWDLYVETGSLRKTEAELTDLYGGGVVDLKNIHGVVRMFKSKVKAALKIAC